MRTENNDTPGQDLSTLKADASNRSLADVAAIFDVVCTERLILRRLRAGDGPAMFAVLEIQRRTFTILLVLIQI